MCHRSFEVIADTDENHHAAVLELMYDFPSERWNEFEFPKLSLRELLAVAKLLGCLLTVAKKRSLFASSHVCKLRLMRRAAFRREVFWTST